MEEREITAIAQDVRRFLEEKWQQWREEYGRELPDGAPPSYDMCRFSAPFAARVLENEIGGEWIVLGGCEEEPADPNFDHASCDIESSPGGFRDSQGQWHGHYWITDDSYSYIVDVTADQFEPGATVLVVDSDDPRYRENFHEVIVEEHMRDVAGRVDGWLQQWQQEYQPSSPNVSM